MQIRRKRGVAFYIIHFIICELLFISLFSVVFIYHGPFGKLRDYIVSTSMETYRYRFFSTWFLSKKDIDRILARTNPMVGNATENIGNISIASHKDPLPGTVGESPGNPPPGDPLAGIAAADNHAAGNPTANSSAAGTGVIPSTAVDTGISVEDVSGPHYKGKLMVIQDPSRITVGLAPEIRQVGAVLSSIVKFYNADGGINAGGFTDIVGAVPAGIVIENGKIRFSQGAKVSYDLIGFNYDNVLVISNNMSLDKIKKSNLRCALSFGPALIINGQPLVSRGGTIVQPRSAIAQRKDGAVLLLVIDGRQPSSRGVNLKELQDILLQNGAYNAANLDGGGSTTLDYNGRIINNPSDVTGERLIASAFLVMPQGK